MEIIAKKGRFRILKKSSSLGVKSPLDWYTLQFKARLGPGEYMWQCLRGFATEAEAREILDRLVL